MRSTNQPNQPRGKFQSKHFDNVLTFDENCYNYLKKFIPFRSARSQQSIKNHQTPSNQGTTLPNSNNNKNRFQVSIRDVLTPSPFSGTSNHKDGGLHTPSSATPRFTTKNTLSSTPSSHHQSIFDDTTMVNVTPPQLFTLSGKALLKSVVVFLQVVDAELIYQFQRLSGILINNNQQNVQGTVNEQGLFVITTPPLEHKELLNDVSAQIQLDCQPFTFLKELYTRANSSTIDEGKYIYQRMLFHFAPSTHTTSLLLSTPSRPPISTQVNLSTAFFPFFQDLDHIPLYLPPFTFNYLQQYGQTMITPSLIKNLIRLPQSPFFFQKSIFCKAVGIQYYTTSSNSSFKHSSEQKSMEKTLTSLNWNDINANSTIDFSSSTLSTTSIIFPSSPTSSSSPFSNLSSNLDQFSTNYQNRNNADDDDMHSMLLSSSRGSSSTKNTHSEEKFPLFEHTNHSLPQNLQNQHHESQYPFPYQASYIQSLKMVENYQQTLINEQKRLYYNTKLVYPSKKTIKPTPSSLISPLNHTATPVPLITPSHLSLSHSNSFGKPLKSHSNQPHDLYQSLPEDALDFGWKEIELPDSYLFHHFPSTIHFSTHPVLQSTFSNTIRDIVELIRFAIHHSSNEGLLLIQHVQHLTNNELILALQLNTPLHSIDTTILHRLLTIDSNIILAIQLQHQCFVQQKLQQNLQTHQINAESDKIDQPCTPSSSLQTYPSSQSSQPQPSPIPIPITPTKQPKATLPHLPALTIPTPSEGSSSSSSSSSSHFPNHRKPFHHNDFPLSPTSQLIQHTRTLATKSTKDALDYLGLPPPTPQTCEKYGHSLSIMLNFAKRFFHDELPVHRINVLLDFLFVSFALHPRQNQNNISNIDSTSTSTLSPFSPIASSTSSPNITPTLHRPTLYTISAPSFTMSSENIDLVPRTLCLERLHKFVYIRHNLSETDQWSTQISEKIKTRGESKLTILEHTQQQMSKLISLLLHHPLFYLAMDIAIDSLCTHQILRESCFHFLMQILQYSNSSQLRYILFNTPLFHPQTIFISGHSDVSFLQFYNNIWKSMNNLSHELLKDYFRYIIDLAFNTLPRPIIDQFNARSIQSSPISPTSQPAALPTSDASTIPLPSNDSTNQPCITSIHSKYPLGLSQSSQPSQSSQSSSNLPPLANNIFYTFFTRNLYALCRNIDRKWSTIADIDHFNSSNIPPLTLSTSPLFQSPIYTFAQTNHSNHSHLHPQCLGLDNPFRASHHTPNIVNPSPSHHAHYPPPPQSTLQSVQSYEYHAKNHYQQLDWSTTQYSMSINQQYHINPLIQCGHFFTIFPFLIFASDQWYIYKYLSILHNLQIFNQETIFSFLSIEYNANTKRQKYYFLQFYTISLTWILNNSTYNKYIQYPQSQSQSQTHSRNKQQQTIPSVPIGTKSLNVNNNPNQSTPHLEQISISQSPLQLDTPNHDISNTPKHHLFTKKKEGVNFMQTVTDVTHFHPLSSSPSKEDVFGQRSSTFFNRGTQGTSLCDLNSTSDDFLRLQPFLLPSSTFDSICHELITNTPYRFDFGLSNWVLLYDQNHIDQSYDSTRLEFNLTKGKKKVKKLLSRVLFTIPGNNAIIPPLIQSLCSDMMKAICLAKPIIFSTTKLTLCSIPTGSLIYQQSTIDLIHNLIERYQLAFNMSDTGNNMAYHGLGQSGCSSAIGLLDLSASSSTSSLSPSGFIYHGPSPSPHQLSSSSFYGEPLHNFTSKGASASSIPIKISVPSAIETNLIYLVRHLFTIDPKVVQYHDPNSKPFFYKESYYSLDSDTKKILIDDPSASAVTHSQQPLNHHQFNPHHVYSHQTSIFSIPLHEIQHIDDYNEEFKLPKRTTGRMRGKKHKTYFSPLKMALKNDPNNHQCGENTLFIVSDQESDEDGNDMNDLHNDEKHQQNGNVHEETSKFTTASQKYQDFALRLFEYSTSFLHIVQSAQQHDQDSK